MRRIRASPYSLIAIGLLATGYGIYLIKRGLEGDTLLPGTLFTYVPRWVFIVTGLLLQLPLPVAIWFLFTIQQLKPG
jgi:hypothetical protein